MKAKKTVRDVDVAGKRVLVRVDFNVPMDENRNITDDTRIRAALPTIRYLMDKGAKVILVSHLGRPKGKPADEFRMDPVARRLGELLGRPVAKVGSCVGEDARAAAASLREGEVLLLENVRFCPGEEKNDPELARALAGLADIYVNDAFGTAHRAHASTEGVARFLPAVAGFLMEKEIETMGKALTSPDRPFVAILGGAKVSDKIGVITNLLDRVDKLVIGGAMAYTFFAAKGWGVGDSLVERDKVGVAADILGRAEARGVPLLLPVDVVVADRFAPDASSKVVKSSEIPDGWQGMDIGPETVKLFTSAVRDARTVIWNGPMGVFEMDRFAVGTESIARALAQTGATTIVGGGDSAAALDKLGFTDRMTHVSTGGGASLEFLEGIELPGVAALTDKS